MASRYFFNTILATALASAAAIEAAADEFAPSIESERELHGSHGGGWGGGGGGGWGGYDGWGGAHSSSSSSSSSTSSGKSGKSGGGSGSGKSGKSGGSSGSGSSSSSSDSYDHKPPHWGAPPGWHGGWPGPSSSSTSSSSGKSGKSGGGGSGKSGKSGGSSGSSSSTTSSHDGWGGPPGWSSGGWGGPKKPGWHGGGWPGKKPPQWGWGDSTSSSSSSGKSGKSGGGGKSSKSGGGKSGKGSKGTSSSSSSSKKGGHWVWVSGWGGPGGGGWDTDGWSSTTTTSTTSSGKSGKSGGSGSGKSGKSGGGSSSSGKSGKSGGGSSGSSTSSADHHNDDVNWGGDGWAGPDGPAPPQIYSKGGHTAGWNSDGWDNDGHYKADIDYVRAHVAKLIEDSERELIPKFLRLGFHDCVGGCDGCVNLDNPDNKGLGEVIEAIYPIVEKFAASYSRADIWALATLVSADLSVLNGRPFGYHFPMRYIGRKDCGGADGRGIGGPDPTMPSADFTTHEVLDYFEEYFGFDADETVTIMGVHAVGVAHREISGFGNEGVEDGWVFDAESYELNNRYYSMLVGGGDDPIHGAPEWKLELVENGDDGIPHRYQWYHERDGKEERPIMLNADVALVRDFKDHMVKDQAGNEGLVTCKAFGDAEEEASGYTRRRLLNGGGVACPVASKTIEKMVEYKMDNELFLYDFEKVLEKMLKNGY